MNEMTNEQLFENEAGDLVFISRQGERYEKVFPVRAYPITAPQEAISILAKEGQELFFIPHLNDLPESFARMVLKVLSHREFMPKITSLLGVSSYACPSTWRVLTDKGETIFILKGEEDIRRLGGATQQGLLITDTYGISYLIENLVALDAKSRKLLDRFL